MTIETLKRIQVADVQARLGPVVHEVATMNIPIIIQSWGEDQAVIVSLRDFERHWPAPGAGQTPEREQVRAALQAAGLQSQPTHQEIAEAQEFEIDHPAEDRERILAEWRQLEIVPAFSEIVLRNRDQVR